jgi:hypothetical protein
MRAQDFRCCVFFNTRAFGAQAFSKTLPKRHASCLAPGFKHTPSVHTDCMDVAGAIRPGPLRQFATEFGAASHDRHVHGPESASSSSRGAICLIGSS